MGRVYRSQTVRSVLREQRRQLKVLGSASVLARSGLSVPEEDVTQVDGSLNVVGDLNVSGAAAITGTLSLPAGIIDNEALAQPVYQSVERASATNFSLTPSFAEKVGVNVTVPVGFSRALVTVFGRLFIYSNPNTTGGADGTGTDALYVSAGIDGNYTYSTPTGISGSGGYATTVGFDSFVLDGLAAGQTLRLNVQACSGYQGIAANVNHYINVVGTFGWLR